MSVEVCFQAITWQLYENQDDEIPLTILVTGRDEYGTVLVQIQNFRPYFYIELVQKNRVGTELSWGEEEKRELRQQILKRCNRCSIKEVKKNILYNYPITESVFFMVSCRTEKDFRKLSSGDFTLYVRSKSDPKRKLIVVAPKYDTPVDNLIKFMSIRDILPSGWLSCKGEIPSSKISYCDKELICDWQSVSRLDKYKTIPVSILSFDFECNSSDNYSFPSALKKADCLFQASCIFRACDGVLTKYLISMKNCEAIQGVKIFNCDGDESLLVTRLGQLIRKLDPDIITGYNINNFDWRYLMDRNRDPTGEKDYFGNLIYENREVLDKFFRNTSRHKTIHSFRFQNEWESSAYSKVHICKVEMIGRTTIDAYNVIRREFKLETFSLNEVSKAVLNQTKDDLSIEEMFKLYRIGTLEAMKRIGTYCIMDSELALSIFDKLQMYISGVEQANVDKVPMSYLSTRGTQIRMIAKMYPIIISQNRVFQNTQIKKKYTEAKERNKEKYGGAFVIEPKPGFYHLVVVLDFTSLYPSIMILNNICCSTYVPNDSELKDSDCVVVEWEDAKGKHKHRYIKAEIQLGIMTQIVNGLLNARKKTKAELREVAKKLEAGNLTPEQTIELQLQYLTLDKRQNSYKISANSCYGILGSDFSHIPCREGAESVTASGRKYICLVKEFAEREFGASVVYGDTDSIMCVFPEVKNLTQAFEKGKELCTAINAFLPKPLNIDMEKVYEAALLFSKKRYCALVYNAKGEFVSYDRKGVETTRRNNPQFLKNCYNKLLDMVMFKKISEPIVREDIDTMIQHLWGTVIRVMTCTIPFEELISSVSINKKEYTAHVPHFKLVEKLRKRGRDISVGTRIKYVYVRTSRKDKTQGEKMEDPEYFRLNQARGSLRLDTEQYIRSKFSTSIDKIFALIGKSVPYLEPWKLEPAKTLLKLIEIRSKVNQSLAECFQTVIILR